MQLPNAKKPGSHLGVDYDPNQPKATMGGNRNKPKAPAVPEYQGPPPPAAPVAPQLPPQQNGPVFPADPPMPVAYNGGHYNPTTAPYGYDLNSPGVSEQFWNNNQDLWMQSPQLDYVDSLLPQFTDPWAGEKQAEELMGSMGNPGAGQQYWNGVQGEFNSMGNGLQGGYKGPNNAQEAYNMTKGMLPGSMQPKFDAYYDRMKDKVMSDVNSQSAARGAYGSNTALNNTIGAGLDVEANRAKAETDFMLADSQNQANWQGMLGNQARGADLSGLGIFDSKLKGEQFGLDKMRLGGDLAFNAEQMDFDKKQAQADLAFGLDDQKLERLGAGISTAINSHQGRRGQLNDAFDASNITQDNRESRVNQLYDRLSGMSQDVQNFFMGSYDTLLTGDMKLFEQQIDAQLAQYADARNWSDTQTAEMKQDLMDAAETYMSIAGIGGKK
jgi:hypothetical protein